MAQVRRDLHLSSHWGSAVRHSLTHLKGGHLCLPGPHGRQPPGADRGPHLVEQHERTLVGRSLSPPILLLRQKTGTPKAEAEACFQQALDVARRQEAKSLELRAASPSVASGSSRASAPKPMLLAPIYGWFTEGFETADLEAKALLENSGDNPHVPPAATDGPTRRLLPHGPRVYAMMEVRLETRAEP